MKQPLSTRAEHQRIRIVDWLREKPLTTYQARQELDVFHPAMRIKELRDAGYEIITYWDTCHTGKARHRVARYVLFSEVQG